MLGAILALPIAAAARDVFRYLFHRLDRPAATPDEALAIVVAHPAIIERPVGDPTEPHVTADRAGEAAPPTPRAVAGSDESPPVDPR